MVSLQLNDATEDPFRGFTACSRILQKRRHDRQTSADGVRILAAGRIGLDAALIGATMNKH
ncbi:MAG: hypothetical protein ABW213_14635 [Tardiphaga sp.]